MKQVLINRRAGGFTLIELVVSITIASIVVGFAAMFIGAPVDAYEAHSRRAVLVNDAAGAWPRMEADLRSALPNSLRASHNGTITVIEMLPVLGVARYKSTPSAASFTTAGVYAGVDPAYLSVNNKGQPGADAYTPGASMAAVSIFTRNAGAAGEQLIGVTPAPAFIADSPKQTLYYVSLPVAYLCDERLGTLRRYSNYSLAPNLASRDTAAELNAAGAASELVAQGLSACHFQVSPPVANQAQTASLRITTTHNGDVVTLLNSWHTEYLP